MTAALATHTADLSRGNTCCWDKKSDTFHHKVYWNTHENANSRRVVLEVVLDISSPGPCWPPPVRTNIALSWVVAFALGGGPAFGYAQSFMQSFMHPFMRSFMHSFIRTRGMVTMVRKAGIAWAMSPQSISTTFWERGAGEGVGGGKKGGAGEGVGKGG